MPLYNFKQQFAPYVSNLTKRQTVRAYRKDGRLPQMGETVHCFTGLRSRGTETATRILPPGYPAKKAETIIILSDQTFIIGPLLSKSDAENRLNDFNKLINFIHAGKRLSMSEKNYFAWQDGFRLPGTTADEPGEAWKEMLSFFKTTHHLPFTGTITYW